MKELIEGPTFEAKAKRHAVLADTGSGSHLWAAMSIYRIADPAAPAIHLDQENLMTIEGPFCLKCEEPWTTQLAEQPCLGTMKGLLHD